jgi:hypothetical protein
MQEKEKEGCWFMTKGLVYYLHLIVFCSDRLGSQDPRVFVVDPDLDSAL